MRSSRLFAEPIANSSPITFWIKSLLVRVFNLSRPTYSECFQRRNDQKRGCLIPWVTNYAYFLQSLLISIHLFHWLKALGITWKSEFLKKNPITAFYMFYFCIAPFSFTYLSISYGLYPYLAMNCFKQSIFLYIAFLSSTTSPSVYKLLFVIFAYINSFCQLGHFDVVFPLIKEML